MKPNLNDQVFWYLKKTPGKQLKDAYTADIAIVGGGMAGLSAAQAFKEKGLSVVLVEKSFCGAGASGKSSGFITPDSEYSLSDLIKRYSLEDGKKLWDFACGGVKHIKQTIEVCSFDCDYQVEDTLVVANGEREFKSVEAEHQDRMKVGYQSTLYRKNDVPQVVGSPGYNGGILYGGSFGINPYLYCQELKEELIRQGVAIYEETPVLKVSTGRLETAYSTITADYIIVCADRFAPDLGLLDKDIFQAQTFIMLSTPLTKKEIRSIFPQKNLMVWDTDLIYTYYRMVNDRLLIGGSNLLSTYVWQAQYHNNHVAKKLFNYARKKFPQVDFRFDYMWPGLIGITKDIIPIAGWSPQLEKVYCISGSAGLPWAAALALYSADHIVDKRTDLDHFFCPTRPFPLGNAAQFFLGKRLTFALSNFKSLSSI